ncbi:hypothetical protein CDL12_14032 [Handroanthus impetiginosus]|uniref:Uncharacterized protein n=1 Tax=Handroanthus impetiginosus TaxID=429701 RepID=A0A2G9H748_9LAMI|nr:hypothetical protein CDL12_14032 [Handroanthus impetiginosus]
MRRFNVSLNKARCLAILENYVCEYKLILLTVPKHPIPVNMKQLVALKIRISASDVARNVYHVCYSTYRLFVSGTYWSIDGDGLFFYILTGGYVDENSFLFIIIA